MGTRRFPTVYEVNTRVYLGELGRALGRPATLDDVPESELARIAELGFDWIWLLGVWQTGPASRAVSRTIPELRREFGRALPDLTDDDICGSCFAITGYTVHSNLGGDAALARLRERLAAHGLRLMLDFVPNHTALDHPWVRSHRSFYVLGSHVDLAREPHNYVRASDQGVLARYFAPVGKQIIAHGRDPYFPGWTDTLQLNYGKPALQEAMRDELRKIAGQCDGVRCDMAMLLLPDVFARTWGISMPDFWPGAITHVRSEHPDFIFMAEVYWDLEWRLQQAGFDFTYDKRLYDRVRAAEVGPIRAHLEADADFQVHSARFLENHDEPRAAATFAADVHEAAAVITYLTPGLRLLHQGQLEGRRTFLPVHLCRAPGEPVNADLAAFYARLLSCVHDPAMVEGTWRLVPTQPAWEGNASWAQFVTFEWRSGQHHLHIVVNYAEHAGQCYVPLDLAPDPPGAIVQLMDLLSPAVYERAAADLSTRGLYLDLPPWGYHVFRVR